MRFLGLFGDLKGIHRGKKNHNKRKNAEIKEDLLRCAAAPANSSFNEIVDFTIENC